MEPDEIHTIGRGMWLTPHEVELLGCIALVLAQTLESLTSGNLVAGSEPGTSRSRQLRDHVAIPALFQPCQ